MPPTWGGLNTVGDNRNGLLNRFSATQLRLANMTPLYSIAVVWLFTYALCEDFCKNTNFFGGAHTTFVNTPRPRDSPVLSGHNLNKRSTDPDGETCKSLTGFESTLKNNTHTVSFFFYYQRLLLV